ncbi:Patatin [Solidesulfovibrio carbinoliphilus subsp. oakridgensis]|uniref:Patatin n=1 Tax=Solidesulfovibrio carbinoliphilus subsp. oakridgensis TaxID=694327 RepID=G7QD22_9BACT|nr:CBASS cGAMP-activated phospholipase [Solidesulfovibrio carbinoliphilus]EHJ46328.1 Patatin [Solidesulfovibrio carbinoliphilus subsp. oakridgensis]
MTRRILCIDGGGILGLIPALVLAEIEARAGRLAGSLFDLVAGTSTGGIIAAAVAAGMPAKTIVDLYRQRGREIFSRSTGHRLATGFGLWGPQYGAAGIETDLADVFGDRKLSDCALDLLVPAYDIEARCPVLFKSAKAGSDARRDYYLRDVCRATAAAPTYFPPARINSLAGEEATLVDGGIYANNPAACALAQAAKAGGLDDVCMVSLGTGQLARPYLYEAAQGWGLAAWARPLLDCMFDGQSDTAAHQCETLLGDRAIRLQPALPRDLAMDDAGEEALATLEAIARGLLADQDALLDKICEMTLPKAAAA